MEKRDTMKRAAVVIFFVGILVIGLTTSALAGGDNSAWVKVPFSFYAGNTLIPAGTYQFSMSVKPFDPGALLKIVSQDGSVCEHLYTSRIEGNPSDLDVRVYFHKYGDTHFLAKMKGPSLGIEVPKSRVEKQLEGTWAIPSPSANPAAKTNPQRSAK
jgi:hypothetical protein